VLIDKLARGLARHERRRCSGHCARRNAAIPPAEVISNIYGHVIGAFELAAAPQRHVQRREYIVACVEDVLVLQGDARG